jgi:hypothetical protein
MEPRPKRVDKSRHKNICCPFYRNCLDHAAKRYWQNWDCSECPHKLSKRPIEANHISGGLGYCELPSDISRHVHERFTGA